MSPLSKSKTQHELQLDLSVETPQWETSFNDLNLLAEKAIGTTLAQAGEAIPAAAPVQISLSFVNDESIQILNNDYRDKDKPTNVLSFPQVDWNNEESVSLALRTHASLGDIVVSYETIMREAIAQDKAPSDHLTHMLVHSTLHLLGMDHELDEQAKEMEALEIQILEHLGIKNPYEVS